MIQSKDYYSILGVDRLASESEIKQAYRKLAMQYHPDKNPTESRDGLANAAFQDINEAYHTLIDKERRAQYNKMMSERAAGVQSHSVQDNQADMAYRHGVEAYKANQFKRAVEYFRAAAKLNPKKAIYYDRLGIAIIKAGGPLEEAKMYCDKAIQMEMYNAEHYLSLGIIYQLVGMAEKAKEQFKEALKWDPNNTQARQRYAIVEKETKKGIFGKLFKK